MQQVHNAPNDLRRHLDSGGSAGGSTLDSRARLDPLPARLNKGYYFNVRPLPLWITAACAVLHAPW